MKRGCSGAAGGPEFARSVYLSANRPEAVPDMSCWCVVGISGRNPVRAGGGESVDPELIEANSYRILRSRIDLSHLPPFTRAVTERMIYVSADFDLSLIHILTLPTTERV
jgi:hypothetical protein